jgi:glycerophosphoryl diester phosphodiesterase
METKVLDSRFLDEFYQGIAHRGLHNKEFTENGLKAFKNAIDHHLAFELDIHLTLDGELLVCHDSELYRTTGKKGIIEHLKAKEIRDNYRLLDGEEVPTFQEVLDLNKEERLIVVELKVYEGNYKPLARAALKTLKKIKNKQKIVLISFDPRALLLTKKGGFMRGLLVCKEKEWVFKLHNLFESVDLETTMLQEKKVINYRHHGGIVNTWTVEDEKTLKEVRPYCDTITFQHLDPELLRKVH